MAKTKHLFVKSNDNEKVQRHTFDEGEIRFTVDREGYKALVAVIRHNQLTWIKNGFSA